ncbi:MAG: TIM44-like domain-containing protein [Pyrinomonadaceae bacterium]
MKKSGTANLSKLAARLSGLITISVSAALLLLFLATEITGRIGGGQSYGGGSGNGGDGGGDGEAIIGIVRLLIYLTIEFPAVGVPVDIIVVVYVVYRFTKRTDTKPEPFSTAFPLGLGNLPGRPEGFARAFEQLRKFDPNFSEIVFSDFCYSLYAKAQDARGHGASALDQFSPYLSDSARHMLVQRNPSDLLEVKGTIIGGVKIAEVRGLDTPIVNISLAFEANYTEVLGVKGRPPTEMTYYVRERWELQRKRDVLSPPPAKATALHCPRCGAPLQRDTVGACAFCRTKIDSGEFQWYVRGIALLNSEAKGPLLTSDVAESGTELSSVLQPNFGSIRAQFELNNPTFSWSEFESRARLIFDELQAAWSTLNWERARPHETDNLFQMHQYWIEAYKRQHLKNILDQCTISGVQPVKIQADAFYHAITLRIWARGYDYTADDRGNIVSGSRTSLRSWSEYWTFVRNRRAKGAAARADLNCPNCAAPLKVNNAGVCQFCGGKITSGEFDWVLSKIEQDESYAG